MQNAKPTQPLLEEAGCAPYKLVGSLTAHMVGKGKRERLDLALHHLELLVALLPSMDAVTEPRWLQERGGRTAQSKNNPRLFSTLYHAALHSTVFQEPLYCSEIILHVTFFTRPLHSGHIAEDCSYFVSTAESINEIQLAKLTIALRGKGSSSQTLESGNRLILHIFLFQEPVGSTGT